MPGASAHEVLGTSAFVFLFFSNRLGCFGSLVVSLVVTLVLLALIGVL